MDKIKEEMLEKLIEIKEKAQNDIKTNHIGYEKCVVKNVIHYRKKVELINKETGKKELFELCVVLVEDPDTHKVFEIYYLNGEEAEITDLLRKYESPKPIKDVIDATNKNKQKPEEEQDKDLERDELEELEAEKKEEQREQEEKEKNKQENNEEKEEKNSLVGKKPKNVIQRINPHTTYVNGLQTVSNAFNISSDVSEIAIAYTEKGDKEALSKDLTMYMLDKDGRIIEESNGKKINELFKIDSATGRNPISDDSTRMKLDGTVEQDANRTMARFKSKEDKDLNISIDQKKVLDHNKVYAGSKVMHGNSDVEVELDRNDIGNIQTDLKMQRIVDYGDGKYKGKKVDEEAREHVAHGDDEEKIPIENADGDKNTVEICNNPYILGTNITWEELAEETGESITELQERFERELDDGKEPNEIIAEIKYDYEMTGHENKTF